MHTTVQFDKFTEFWILTIYTVVLIFFSSNQIMLLLLFLWNMWRTTCQHQKYWKCCLANFAVKHQISCRQKRRHYHHPCHCYQLHCLQWMSHAACSDSDLHRCMYHCKGVWSSHRKIAVFGIGLRIYRTPTPSLGAGGWSVQSIVSVPSLMIQPAKHY